MADNREGKAPGNQQAPAPKSETKLYSVRGPGSVIHGGKVYTAGAEMQLTDEEAAALGNEIRVGKAPPVDHIEKRQGGKYRVAKGATLWHEGKAREPGYEITLDSAEARKLAEAVEPA